MPRTILPLAQKNIDPWEELSAIQARVVRKVFAPKHRYLLNTMIKRLYDGPIIRRYACDLAVLDAVRCLEGESCDELAATLF